MKVQKYQLGHSGVRIAVLADLHNKPWEKILAQTQALGPDIIAVPGDVTYGFEGCDRVAGFLAACAAVAPTYLSLGNHDDAEVIAGIRGTVTLLQDAYVDIQVNGVPLRIGGIHAPSSRMGRPAHRMPNTDWLPEFCQTDRCKILLSHQPEHYCRYLQGREIDLVLAGHAHGGQWRIPFTNQGIYAPGQGLFPKLTGGVIDGRLVISRGLSNSVWLPRLFNPREIVVVDI